MRSFIIYGTLHLKRGTRWYISIPDGVIRILRGHKPIAPPHYGAGAIVQREAKGYRCVGLTNLLPLCADCLETSWKSQSLSRDCFTLLASHKTKKKKIKHCKFCGTCSTHCVTYLLTYLLHGAKSFLRSYQ
jgi:hypothetical protein